MSTALVVAGALLVAHAGLTVLWQEPLSAAYTWFIQRQLDDELERLEAPGLSPLVLRALQELEGDEQRLAVLARSLERRVDDGQAIATIEIPSIDLDRVVVEGSGTAALRKGPGIIGETRFPGADGIVAIAGHRTTYGAPFRDIDALRRGDAITVTMPYARFEYEVHKTRIVAPTAVEVLRGVSYERLALIACHPLYSAAQRIVVFARLRAVTPRNAGARETAA